MVLLKQNECLHSTIVTQNNRREGKMNVSLLNLAQVKLRLPNIYLQTKAFLKANKFAACTEFQEDSKLHFFQWEANFSQPIPKNS